MPEHDIEISGYAGTAELSMDQEDISKDAVKAAIKNPEKSSRSGDTVVVLGGPDDQKLRVMYSEDESHTNAYILGVSSED